MEDQLEPIREKILQERADLIEKRTRCRWPKIGFSRDIKAITLDPRWPHDLLLLHAIGSTHERTQRYVYRFVTATGQDHIRGLIVPGLIWLDGRHVECRFGARCRGLGLQSRRASNTESRCAHECDNHRESGGASDLHRSFHVVEN
jgi:hypothetical protein